METVSVKPTKEQFEDFVKIRNSGLLNMFDVSRVCALSTNGLSRGNCLYIFHNFEALADEYAVEV